MSRSPRYDRIRKIATSLRNIFCIKYMLSNYSLVRYYHVMLLFFRIYKKSPFRRK